MTPVRCPRRTLIAAACLAALSTVVQAQTAPADAKRETPAAVDGPQVITVTADREKDYNARSSNTATGMELSRRETPQAISIITQQQMQDFGLRTINQVLAITPGVTVESVETDRTYFSARGFDITNFQVDGIGLPFTNGSQWGDIDTALYERVEVLRGANGLLTSTGNPSATVNFVRKRPTREFQASGGLTVGSWDDARLDLDVSGGLNASGSVRGRVIAAAQSKDSYLDRYHKDLGLFSAALEADLRPGTTLSVGYDEQRSNADSPLWGALPLVYTDGTPTDYDVSTSTASKDAWWDNTDRRVYAELTQQLGSGWEAKATLTHRELSGDSNLFYVYGTPDKTTPGSDLYSYPSLFTGDYTQRMADLRANGPFELGGRRHQAMVGIAWADEQAEESSAYNDQIGIEIPDLDTWDGSFPLNPFDPPSAGSDFKSRRTTVFASTQLNIADPFKLIVGVNATQVDSSGANYGVAHAYSESEVSPYLGATFELTREVSLYGSYAKIFNPQSEVDANQQILDPIRGRSVEAGVKSEWLDKRLMASLAVFRVDQDNTAEADPFVPGQDTTYHGINARSTGFELEVSGQVLPGWMVNAGYTQLKLEGDDGEDVRTYVPRKRLTLATTYALGMVPGLKLGGSVRWQDDIHLDLGGGVRAEQKAYALLDLMARYELNKHWAATLNVSNVTDKKYWSSLYWTQAFYGEPRKVSANVTWTY